MKKLFRICLLFILTGLFLEIPAAYSQDCNFEFNYNTIENESNQFTLKVVPVKAEGRFVLKLYDLMQGKVVSQKQINITSLTQIVEFSGVEPSTYTVYISQDGCDNHKTLGGIEGIELSSKR